MHEIVALRAAVIVILALSIGAEITVARLYYRAYTKLPRRAGLAPLHVALVSVGVLLLQSALAWALIETITREATTTTIVRTVMYGLGSLIVLVALYIVGELQRRRLTTVVVAAPCHRAETQDVDRG